MPKGCDGGGIWRTEFLSGISAVRPTREHASGDIWAARKPTLQRAGRGMSGKVIAVVLALCCVLAGGGLYYLQVYGFYDEIAPSGASDVMLTALHSGNPEAVKHEGFQAIDAESSPLRYRACFTTDLSLAALSEAYVIHEDPVPTVAPGWFECFDASAIGAALETGSATAFLGTGNVVYGFDRVVAVSMDGHGYVWHQLNLCGERHFDGESLPEGCPPPPKKVNK